MSVARPTAILGLSLVLVSLSSFGGSQTAQAETSNDDRGSAVELFEESERSYREGRFERAIELLERAYAIDADPILLYNMARAQERLGRFDEAVTTYRRYLESAPDAPDRDDVSRHVEELVASHGDDDPAEDDTSGNEPAGDDPTEDSPAEGPPPEAEVVPVEGGRGGRTLVRALIFPIVFSGLGLLTITTGGILGGLSLSAHEDALEDPDFMSAWDSQLSAEQLALAANVFFGVGAAVLLGSVVWGIVTWLRHRRRRAGGRRTDQVVGSPHLEAIAGALPPSRGRATARDCRWRARPHGGA